MRELNIFGKLLSLSVNLPPSRPRDNAPAIPARTHSQNQYYSSTGCYPHARPVLPEVTRVYPKTKRLATSFHSHRATLGHSRIWQATRYSSSNTIKVHLSAAAAVLKLASFTRQTKDPFSPSSVKTDFFSSHESVQLLHVFPTLAPPQALHPGQSFFSSGQVTSSTPPDRQVLEQV